MCTPQVAQDLALDPTYALQTATLEWHGQLTGRLYLLTLTIRAVHGYNLLVEATTFVPDVASAPARERRHRPLYLVWAVCTKYVLLLIPTPTLSTLVRYDPRIHKAISHLTLF